MRRLTLAVVLAAAGLLLHPASRPSPSRRPSPHPTSTTTALATWPSASTGETVGGRAGAGAVSVLFGSAGSGLGGGQFLYQGTGGLGGAAESGDAVAAALG